MKTAEIILFGIQCFNLGVVIMLGVYMLITQIEYNKSQKEYRKKEKEILSKYEKLKGEQDVEQGKDN